MKLKAGLRSVIHARPGCCCYVTTTIIHILTTYYPKGTTLKECLNHKNKLNSERLTVRLELTVLYFPIFCQARPDFFRECLQQL